MKSLKSIQLKIGIFGTFFVINSMKFTSKFTTEHEFNWLNAICAIASLIVVIGYMLDLKNKNYTTTE
ncbi:hypothetical protein [Lysinibacillus sp. JNUCC 51]|uniref:hypothetical protein n=1 Tax=Lysinibacillus sp. JNUCC-51 TaxID=2792479 RepID=UPI00193819A4|nr:hypothetical protein JNUCC51_12685 [Lysinibacillus sp. JNUCC-51]